MKKRLLKNIWMKLLSLVLAIVLWIIVVNMDNPVERKTFYNIPVTLLHQSEVSDRDKIIEVIKGDKVDITVEGRRATLENLKGNDFLVTADLTEISVWDTVMVQVTVPEYPEVKVMNNNQNVVKLIFDDYITKPYSFRINTSGTPMNNYVIGDAYASPNILQISGAKTVLDKVKEVVLEVNVDGKNEDFSARAVPLVYDMNGELIDSSKLTMGLSSVNVTVPVLQTKKLKVRVETTGVLPEGYEILAENIAFQPETVQIAGRREELDAVGSYLTVNVDVSEKTGTIEKNVIVLDQLDDALTSLRAVDNAMVAVTVKITPFVDKVIEAPVEKISLRDISPLYNVEILQTTTPIRLKCRAARANFLSAESVSPYVSLLGLTEGTYHLEVQFDLPTGILLDAPTYLDVTLLPKQETTPNPAARP